MEESVIFDEKIPDIVDGSQLEKKIMKKITNLEKKYKSLLKDFTTTNKKSILTLQTNMEKHDTNLKDISLKILKLDSIEKDLDVIKTKSLDNNKTINDMLTNLKDASLKIESIEKDLDVIKTKNLDNNKTINNRLNSLVDSKQKKIKQDLIVYQNEQNKKNQKLYLYSNLFLTICIIGFNYFRR
jgi:hypothetical protein